jgi:PST family polysaccharide transporter
MLVPLATFPYLIRVLGKETYGLVIYAQVVVSYLQIIVNFGFNTSAIKEISLYRDNKSMLNEVVSSIFIIRGLLFLLSAFILSVLIFILPQARDHKLLFALSMWACFYDFIFPVWYFQGVEKMKYITYLTLISRRSIFIVLVFVLINRPDDYLVLPMIYGVGAVVSGGLAIFVLYKNEEVRLFLPSTVILYKRFLNSVNFFISDVSVSVFTNSNRLIIGAFLGFTELAYYDLADRIINIFRTIPLNIVKNTIYAKVALTKNIDLVRKTTIVMSIYAVIAILFINIFASQIVLILGGIEMLPAIIVVRILSILIFTTHLSNYYITIDSSWDMIKKFRNDYFINSLFDFTNIYFLVLLI